jgi:hypothetical protein
MRRKSGRSGAARAESYRSRRAFPAALDAFARQTVELFARIMIRAGYSRAAIARAVKTAAVSIPQSVRATARGSRADLADAGHILTLWAQDPDYLLPNGTLRPIPARGPAPSIEALVARVTPRLTFQEGWSQLDRTSTLRRVGTRYVPRDEAIIYLGDRQLLAANTLRVLNACLQNLEHNAERGASEPWYLRSAQHADFPLAAVNGYLDESIQRGMQFLKAEDGVMLRVAKTAPSTRQRRRVSVNLFYAVLDDSTPIGADTPVPGTSSESPKRKQSLGKPGRASR